MAGDVVENAQHADHRGWVDAPVVGLVVEADVAGDDRRCEFRASVTYAANNLLHLVVDLWAFGVAEVEAVGHRDRLCAGADDVASRLGDGHRSAGVRAELSIAAVTVDADRDGLRCAFDSHYGGVGAGCDDGVREDALVVLAVDPALRGDVRRGEEADEGSVWISHRRPLSRARERGGSVAISRRSRRSGSFEVGKRHDVEGLELVELRRADAFAGVFGRFDESIDGERSHLAGAVHNVNETIVGHVADDRPGDLPALEETRDIVGVAFTDDNEHALLRLGEHDLIWRHGFLTARDFRYIDHEAGPPARGRFGAGCREPGRAEVLDARDPIRMVVGKVEAGLHEHLLEEGVAHLHRGPQLLEARVGIGAGGEAGGTVNTIAAGIGADEHQQVARTFRLCARESIDGRDADAHGVDEWVGGVGAFEEDLAADGRDAEAVAVPGNAGDNAVEEIAVARDRLRAGARIR